MDPSTPVAPFGPAFVTVAVKVRLLPCVALVVEAFNTMIRLACAADELSAAKESSTSRRTSKVIDFVFIGVAIFAFQSDLREC